MLHLGPELFSNSLGNTRWRLLQGIVSMGLADVRMTAERTGLAISTVRSYMDQFLNYGLLARQGVREGVGGRPGQIFGFSRNAGLVVGVELGRQAVEVSVVDLTGTVVGTSRKSMVLSNPPPTAVQEIAVCVRESLKRLGIDHRQVIGVGAAVEGLFYGPDDVWPYWPAMKSLDRMPLQSMLSKELELPVLVEDHGRARLLVETRQGVLRDVSNAVLVWVGTGIAAYFYFDGKVFRSASGMNGEFGHLIIEPEGPVCACGRRGCLEAVSSVPKIEEIVRRQVASGDPSNLTSRFAGRSEHLTIHDIVGAADLDDQMAYVVLHQAGERLGRAISTMLNIVGPMTVVIGGVLAGSSVVLDSVRRVVKLEVVGMLFPKIDIQTSRVSEDAGSFGAALLAIEDIFASPYVPKELLAVWCAA
jgi:predicted NBD/HSP70 family sugar kinase